MNIRGALGWRSCKIDWVIRGKGVRVVGTSGEGGRKQGNETGREMEEERKE